VRGEVVEDVQLARAYRAAGLPVWCLAGGDQVVFRMYPGGLRSLVQGWSKNLAVGAGLGPRAAVLGAVVWAAGGLAATAALGGGVASWAGGGAVPWVPALLWALVALQWWWALRRVGPLRWWTPVLFPVPLVAFVALFARSAALRALGRPATWRGRPVPVGRAREGA
jgi:4,4'-diaponeurosporenoate glycosyltransferase